MVLIDAWRSGPLTRFFHRQACWVYAKAAGVSCNYACGDLWLDCSHHFPPLGAHEASLITSQLGVSCDEIKDVKQEQPADTEITPFLQIPPWDSPAPGSTFTGAGSVFTPL
jgi:hypothetical protein